MLSQNSNIEDYQLIEIDKDTLNASVIVNINQQQIEWKPIHCIKPKSKKWL